MRYGRGRRLAAGTAVLAMAGTLLAAVGLGSGTTALAKTALANQVRLPDDTGSARGDWSVATRSGGRVLVWRAAGRLPVTDARPELRVPADGDTRLAAVPRLTADGRGLVADLVDLAGVDISRLQVWLGADRLDRPGRVAPAYRSAPVTGGRGVQTVPVETLAADPAAPGPHSVATPYDYRSEPLPWREFKAPMEVRGHVVQPREVDDAPLVLFLHGRHQPCYGPGWSGDWPCDGQSRPVPSQLGYEYVQRRLATQGYASVSIAANAINAQDYQSPDGGAKARSALVRHHLRLLAQWQRAPRHAATFGRMNLDRTVLVGHSRGGAGVARAVLETTADAPYDVLGQVLIAPTNFSSVATPYVPSVTLLPYCDGDVIDLQGETYTDLARDLGTADTAFRSSVLMRGANHNFFNTEWTPGISQAPSFDDWFDQRHRLCARNSDTRLTATEQRRAGLSWVTAAVRLFGAGETSMLEALDASGAVTVPKLRDGAVWTHALGGDRRLVRPGTDAAAGGPGQLCRAMATGGFLFHRRLPICGVGLNELRMLHWFVGRTNGLPWPVQLLAEWQRAGPAGGLALDDPLDATGSDTSLDLRVTVDPREGAAPLRVRLADADGSTWTSARQNLIAMTGHYIRTWWAQTLRVDLAVAPPRLDRAALTEVALVASSGSGRVWLLDAAARRPALLPVPDRSVPTVSVPRRTSTDEGDPGDRIEVDWQLSAPAPSPGRFAIVARSSFRASGGSVSLVRVPAGVSSGTVQIDYDSDTTDDLPTTRLGLEVVPLRDLAVGSDVGRLIVRDDDPNVRARVTRRDPSVNRGGRMTWVVRLNKAVDYKFEIFAGGPRTRPESEMMRVGDARRRWVDDHVGGRPKALLGPRVFELLRFRPGDHVERVSVPTRVNSLVHEHPRTLTLRFEGRGLDGGAERSTIRLR